MEFTVVPLSEEDREPVIDIFNYYVENSFAAFLEQKLPYEAFGMLVNLSQGFPAGAIRDPSGRTVGFGLLRFHNAMPAFSRTAEATYFIHPDYTGRGLGTLLLEFLTQIAAAQGVTNILASISSLNPGSIQFHKKNGFRQCGRFKKVGEKKGRRFDTVWMQKML